MANLTKVSGLQDRLARLPKSIFLLLGCLTLVLIGMADYATGYELSLTVFYLGVVVLVAWNVGPRASVCVSGVAAALWLLVERMSEHPYSHMLLIYWNALEKFGLFLLVVYIITALRGALDSERTFARTDHLTGLANRREFLALLNAEISRVQRYPRPFTLAYVDVDSFKVINDHFGHLMGDAVLRAVASTFRNNLRATDTIGRLGGDEFAILLPETPTGPSLLILNKLQERLSEVMQNKGWAVTCSIGAVTFNRSPDSLETALQKADDAMYLAKRSGRNVVKHEMVDGTPEVHTLRSPASSADRTHPLPRPIRRAG